MKSKVYIETSIPSFYYEIRQEPEMVARRNWTRKWWNRHRKYYKIVTSEAVTDELGRGDYPNKDKTLAMICKLTLLPIGEEISEIVQSYIQHQLMPKNPLGDAFHLAIISFHKNIYILIFNLNIEFFPSMNHRCHINFLNALQYSSL